MTTTQTTAPSQTISPSGTFGSTFPGSNGVQTGMPPPNLPNPGAQDLATSPSPSLSTTPGGVASPGTTTTTATGVPGTSTVTGSDATSATIPSSTSATIVDPTATVTHAGSPPVREHTPDSGTPEGGEGATPDPAAENLETRSLAPGGGGPVLWIA